MCQRKIEKRTGNKVGMRILLMKLNVPVRVCREYQECRGKGDARKGVIMLVRNIPPGV